MARFRKCPVCGASIKLDNLDQHAQKVHPGQKVGWNLTPEEQTVVVDSRRPVRLGQRERLLYPVLAVVVVAGIILGVVVLAPPPAAPGPQVAPNFTLQSSDGEAIRLSDFRGSVVFLNFMDTHCSHCQQETGSVLVSLHGAYGDRVIFLSVDVGFIGPPDDMNDIRAFKATYGATWTYVLDDGSARGSYGITATPTSYILRDDQTVQSSFRGSTAYSALAGALDAALGAGG